MQGLKIILTWESIYDILDITEYIERDFGIERADKFEIDIKHELAKLEYIGGIFGKTQIYYRSYSIYKKPFPPSIIFYIVNEAKQEVHVLRVLREETDWEKTLSGTTEYTYPE